MSAHRVEWFWEPLMTAFILASRSPVRATLLASAGLDFETIPATIDERAVEAGFGAAAPAAVAKGLAEEKARVVSAGRPGRIVIGADQTLAIGADRMTKAADLDAARATLRRLQGRTHALHSGFAVVVDGRILGSGAVSATLTMRPLSGVAIERYLDKAGPSILGSVGCYQLEGFGVTLLQAIEGDYFTILGL